MIVSKNHYLNQILAIHPLRTNFQTIDLPNSPVQQLIGKSGRLNFWGVVFCCLLFFATFVATGNNQGQNLLIPFLTLSCRPNLMIKIIKMIKTIKMIKMIKKIKTIKMIKMRLILIRINLITIILMRLILMRHILMGLIFMRLVLMRLRLTRLILMRLILMRLVLMRLI